MAECRKRNGGFDLVLSRAEYNSVVDVLANVSGDPITRRRHVSAVSNAIMEADGNVWWSKNEEPADLSGEITFVSVKRKARRAKAQEDT